MSDTNKQIKIKLLGITDQDLSMPVIIIFLLNNEILILHLILAT
jgi:hypothetical protein